MTIPPETERGYGKPRQEVARALIERSPTAGYPKGSHMRSQPIREEAARDLAEAALVVLRKKGWLSDLGITAIEDEGKTK